MVQDCLVNDDISPNVIHKRAGHPPRAVSLLTLMPPQIRTEKVRKEGRTVLALQALRKGQFSSNRAASRVYNIPKSTLDYRIRGRATRVKLRANNHKLSITEEQALIQ